MEELKQYLKISSDPPHDTKKFVFQVYDENIEYVENLSYQDKNDLINTLLKNYIVESKQAKAFRNQFNSIKRVVLIVLSIIIGIPAIIYFTGISFHMTKNSYIYMQHNFEKLF